MNLDPKTCLQCGDGFGAPACPDRYLAENVPVGAEVGEDGFVHGRDPRKMTPEELRAMGHLPMSKADVIRRHCLDCCGGSADEVRKCMALRCPSWPERMGGRSPFLAKPAYTAEQREAMRERARTLSTRKQVGVVQHDEPSSASAGTGEAATLLPAA